MGSPILLCTDGSDEALGAISVVSICLAAITNLLWSR